MLGVLAALAGRHRRRLAPAVALLLYLPAIHIWLHTEARYTAEARPLLLMFVAVFVSFIVSRSTSTSLAAIDRRHAGDLARGVD
jgi:hypothetical protein